MIARCDGRRRRTAHRGHAGDCRHAHVDAEQPRPGDDEHEVDRDAEEARNQEPLGSPEAPQVRLCPHHRHVDVDQGHRDGLGARDLPQGRSRQDDPDRRHEQDRPGALGEHRRQLGDEAGDRVRDQDGREPPTEQGYGVLEVHFVRLLLDLARGLGDVVDLLLPDTRKAVERARPPLTRQDDREVGQVDEVVDQHDHTDHLARRVEALGHRGEVARAADPAARQRAEARPRARWQAATEQVEGDRRPDHDADGAHREHHGPSPRHLHRLADVDVQQHEDDEHRHRERPERGVDRARARDDVEVAEGDRCEEDPDDGGQVVEDLPVHPLLEPYEGDRDHGDHGHDADEILEDRFRWYQDSVLSLRNLFASSEPANAGQTSGALRVRRRRPADPKTRHNEASSTRAHRVSVQDRLAAQGRAGDSAGKSA